MKGRRTPLRRLVFIAVAGVLAVGIVAPLFNADGLRGRVREALERALQRRVEVGEVRLALFTGAGFSVADVTIHEDPKIGLEPFAYVPRLDARVNVRKLFAGRLEFSSLRLVDPSVNLARSEGKPWNIAPLLSRAAGAAIPYIQVSGGRINFRSGERKSVYYVSNTDLALAPASAGFDIGFSGEPARTDRSARGFGSFRGTLRWRPAEPRERQVALDVELEPSAIAEILKLLEGRNVGLHGLLASRATIQGSPDRLRIRGEARIEDVHRWDLMTEHGRGWTLPYRGVLDVRDGTLDLSTQAIPEAGLQLRLRAAEVFGKPRGAAHLILRKTPAGPLLSAARHLGLRLPEAASASGGAFGVVGYSFGPAHQGALEGRVRFSAAALTVPGAPPVRFAAADVLLKQGALELAPALAEFGNSRATLEGSYDPAGGAFDIRVSTRDIGIDEFRSELTRLVGSTQIPMLRNTTGGSFSGTLAYKASGAWSGTIHVRKTTIDVPGLAVPVTLQSASVTIEGAKLHITRMEAEAGDVVFGGEYRYEPLLVRPHRFHLRVPRLTAAQVETLLAPSLGRRQGFIARTFRLGPASVPEWLRNRRASGIVEAGTFEIAGAEMEELRARVNWDATEIDLVSVDGRWKDSSLSISGNIELAGPGPHYALQGRLQNVAWNGGRVDVDGLVRTSGMGAQLLNGLRAEGTFTGRSITLQSDAFRTIGGCFDLVLDRGVPRLKLAGVQASQGQESFYGDGGTQPDGRIRMELAGARSQLHVELEPTLMRQ